jgi:hypothetical protein
MYKAKTAAVFAVAYPFVRIAWTRDHGRYDPQDGCPIEVTLSFPVRCSRVGFEAYRARFSEQHVRGEWYRFAGDLAAFVRLGGDEETVRRAGE